jgi:hypothetical protein
VRIYNETLDVCGRYFKLVEISVPLSRRQRRLEAAIRAFGLVDRAGWSNGYLVNGWPISLAPVAPSPGDHTDLGEPLRVDVQIRLTTKPDIAAVLITQVETSLAS